MPNRNNSEKLTSKLKEQAKSLLQLNSDKEKLVNENEALKLQMKRMSQSLENTALDKEKIKVKFTRFFLRPKGFKEIDIFE